MQLKEDKEQANTVSPSSECDLHSIVACIKSEYYDYIGVAITPWHARMAVASFLKLRSNCLIETGILLIDRHSKDGFLAIPEADVPGLDVAYLERSGDGMASMAGMLTCRLILPLLQAKKKNGRLIYIANPSFPGSIFDSPVYLALDYRFSYVLLDEGVGSYLSSAEDWAKRSIKDRGLHGLSAAMRNWLFNHERRELPKLIRMLEVKNRFEKFYLFKYDGSLNEDNAVFVKKSFELSSKNADGLTHSINERYKGAIVFCSQFPLVEDGSISLDAHLKAVSATYEVSKSLGVPLVIKAHPRESDTSIYDEFDAYIDSRNGIALEDILSDIDKMPLCIASLCSTAMISSAAIFNCCGIGLSKFLIGDETSKGFVQFCESLESLFGVYFITPSTIDEFRLFLQHNDQKS